MAEIVSVLSGKGGVGKTVLTSLFGYILSNEGKRVLLIDADMGMRNLDLLLGIENECLYNIWDVAQGQCFLEDAIIPVKEGMDFLAASQRESWNDLFSPAINTVIDDVFERYDYIFLDSPAGMGIGIDFAREVSQKWVVVIDSSWASKRNADRIMTLRPKRTELFAVLNRFAISDKKNIPFFEMLDTVDLDDFGGVLPYSSAVDQFSHHGNVLASPLGTAFGDCLKRTVDTVFLEKEYPISVWEKALLIAEREEYNAREITIPDRKAIGLSWHSSGRAYKWQRRR